MPIRNKKQLITKIYNEVYPENSVNCEVLVKCKYIFRLPNRDKVLVIPAVNAIKTKFKFNFTSMGYRVLQTFKCLLKIMNEQDYYLLLFL